MAMLTAPAREPKVSSPLFDGVSQIFSSESTMGYRRAAIALLVIFVAVGILQCALGAPPITGPWDVASLLDGAWRIVNGQVPNTDYHAPLGSLTYLLVAFGMKIAGPSTRSITYGITMLVALLLPIAWRISKIRLPWMLAFLFVTLCGSYLLSPEPPGYAFRDTTYAMLYNREGYVFLCILCVCIFLKPHIPAGRAIVMDGIFAGFLLGLVFYCKITYFAAALPLIFVAALMNPASIGWYLSASATFAGVCAAFFTFFHISVRSYLSDIWFAGRAQSPSMRLKLLSEGVSTNAMWMYLLLFALVLWTWTEKGERANRDVLRAWLAAVSIVAMALFIESGNGSQGGGADDPLYFIGALISLELFRHSSAHRDSNAATTRVVHAVSLLLLVPLLLGSILFHETMSFAYTVAWDVVRRPLVPASQRFHARPLRDFNIPAGTDHITAYWPSREYSARINDGLDLLRRHLQEGDRITALDYGNPFSFALGTKPAKDGNLWWDLDFTFDRQHYPAPSEVLGDATVVMVPRLSRPARGFGLETFEAMMDLYGKYLHEHFYEVESSSTWTMFRRNPGE